MKRRAHAAGAAATDDAGGKVLLARNWEAVRDVWQALETQAAGSAYQTWGFHAAWLASHGEEGEPLIAVAHHEGAPALILPLVRQGRTARLPGGRHLNIGLPLVDGRLGHDTRAVLLKKVFAALRAEGVDLVIMHNAVPDALGVSAVLPRGLRIQTEWFFEGELLDDYDRLLKERRGKKTKGKLKRKLNRLREAEGFEIRRITARAEGEAVIDALIEQKVARFSRKNIRTGFEDPRFREFCLRMLDTGALRLDVMFAEGRPLAIYGGGECNGRYSAYFSSIEENSPYLKYGPGEVLLAHIVADACARGLKVLDLGVGTMAYKTSWCNRRLPVHTILAPLGIGGWIRALPRAGWLAVRPHLKRLLLRHAGLRRLAERVLSRGIG